LLVFKLKIIPGMELPPATLIQVRVDKIPVVGVFLYHNGAESYYGARAFGGSPGA
jgi:hypothetical protein